MDIENLQRIVNTFPCDEDGKATLSIEQTGRYAARLVIHVEDIAIAVENLDFEPLDE